MIDLRTGVGVAGRQVVAGHRVAGNADVGFDLVAPDVPAVHRPAGEELQVRAGAEALDHDVDFLRLVGVVLPGQHRERSLPLELHGQLPLHAEQQRLVGMTEVLAEAHLVFAPDELVLELEPPLPHDVFGDVPGAGVAPEVEVRIVFGEVADRHPSDALKGHEVVVDARAVLALLPGLPRRIRHDRPVAARALRRLGVRGVGGARRRDVGVGGVHRNVLLPAAVLARWVDDELSGRAGLPPRYALSAAFQQPSSRAHEPAPRMPLEVRCGQVLWML